ncbi:MAG: hypothetical protein HY717_07945 [Planctomycetes bacterium]|nr:hypothetical protein [Planctomycetota bacterium]
MLSQVKEVLLGNWRNKGVALFFAGTIWYVAYQSELRTEDIHVNVDLAPQQENKVIISRESARGDGQPVKFTGDMVLKVQGTRKQIESLPKAPLARILVKIDAGSGIGSQRKRYFFSTKDFSLPDPHLVGILSFSPEYVEVVFDDQAELESKVVTAIPVPSGFEKEMEVVEPAAVKAAGPRSILEKIQWVAEVGNFDASSRRFEGEVPLSPRFPESIDESVVRSTVKLPVDKVKLTFQLRYKLDAVADEAVRVRFIVPPVKYPFQVKFEENTVPIVFKGPEREIQLLKEKIKEPDFFLGVKVPEAELSAKQEHTFTFTEDQLILFGFSREIQKLQHEKRKGLVAWSYTIVPVRASEEKG